MNTQQIIKTTSKQVACDGGQNGLGHPKIWLTIGHSKKVTCPYCSKTFVLQNPDTAKTK